RGTLGARQGAARQDPQRRKQLASLSTAAVPRFAGRGSTSAGDPRQKRHGANRHCAVPFLRREGASARGFAGGSGRRGAHSARGALQGQRGRLLHVGHHSCSWEGEDMTRRAVTTLIAGAAARVGFSGSDLEAILQFPVVRQEVLSKLKG